jgi:hypothetical protein
MPRGVRPRWSSEVRPSESGPTNYSSLRVMGGGIMISRRPNTRASTENRPGPSPIDVTSIVSAKISADFESKTFGVQVGSKESRTPTPPTPTRVPIIGVRKPKTSRHPAMMADKPITQAAAGGFNAPM